jgi:hypothetical protein
LAQSDRKSEWVSIPKPPSPRQCMLHGPGRAQEVVLLDTLLGVVAMNECLHRAGFLIKVPLLYSLNATRSSCCVFITMGPYHAIGSPWIYPMQQEAEWFFLCAGRYMGGILIQDQGPIGTYTLTVQLKCFQNLLCSWFLLQTDSAYRTTPSFFMILTRKIS